MFGEDDKGRLENMVTAVCYSPLFYLALSFVLSSFRIHAGINLRLLSNIMLGASFAAVLLSRLLHVLLIPADASPGPKRIAAACLLLAGIGEAVSVCGAVAVWMGAPLQGCAPFLIISALYLLDFRVFRFPAIISRWPKEK
jgi:hypothetical protein